MKATFAKFDMDSGYVYAKLADGNIFLIDCTAYERTHADNMYERSALDYLIYNNPEEYVELVLDDNPAAYLKSITQYTFPEN